MNLGLSGHVVVVTGAARGIGAATAHAFAAEGCKAVAWDRDLEPALAVARAITEAGGEALGVQVDVTSAASVEQATERTLARFGTLQVLVNNAGFSLDASIMEMTEEQWDTVMNVCLKVTFLCTRAVVPTMLAQAYGRIVNIASRGHLGPNRTSRTTLRQWVVS